MINQEISDMVSYGQVSYPEAECWHDNKERMLKVYPMLRHPEDDFAEWFSQQPVYLHKLGNHEFEILFQRYNSLCISRGGTGFLAS